MTQAGLSRLRAVLGWTTSLVFLLVAAALIDGFVTAAKTPVDAYTALPGTDLPVTGPIPPNAADRSGLLLEGSSPAVGLTLASEFKGFWMGGQMWKGAIKVAEDAAPGVYTVTARPREDDPRIKPQVFTVTVYADADAMDAASPSVIRRQIGWPPFAAAGALFPLILVLGGGVFLVSRRMEHLLIAQGKAEVYMLKKTPEGLLITFGLGSRHGLSPGVTVLVRDDAGYVVAEATVVRCSEADAAALVAFGGKVDMGDVVCAAGAPPPPPTSDSRPRTPN